MNGLTEGGARNASVPEVSVVVTFYNIEECVGYCVESLLDQTYRSYELVLVDDGSTDGTPALLDAYRSHPNVRVLHKANGGPADARNAGIAACSGAYVTFVDGDDLVSPYYLEFLVASLEGSSNRMVVGQPKNVRISDALAGGVRWGKPIWAGQIYGQREAMGYLLYEKIEEGPWAKLAPRWVYEQHPFPKGRYYEDIATIATFILDLEEFAIVEEPIYGYVMRDESVVHCKSASSKQVKDFEWAISVLAADVRESYPGFSSGAIYLETLQLSRLYMLVSTADLPEGERCACMRGIERAVRENLPAIVADLNVAFVPKVRFFLLAWMPRLYCIAIRGYEKLAKGV